jgi:hypothetical protein
MMKKGMNLKSLRQQAGISLVGAIIIMALLAMVFLVAARTLPSITEYRSELALIKKCAAETKNDVDARNYFDRNAYLQDISSIQGKDLTIERSGDGVAVSFAYEKKIPLAGPVSLAIDYAGKSDRGS